MSIPLREHASSAAAISLIAGFACMACLMPPFHQRVLHSPALITLIAIALACSIILHLLFVGVLARAYGKSPVKYAALALLTLPIGSIVGLILLEWHAKMARSNERSAA